MRQIKFRGKDLKTGEWRYGDLEIGRKTKIVRIHTYHEDGEYCQQYIVNENTVGQFTGLQDKNGREIYEGDILGFDALTKERLEVRFVRGVFAFLWNGDLDGEFLTGSPTHEWAEVVGNVYDDKELLKQ